MKVIAAINMTLDGYCDHNAMIADEELHQHYNDLLKTADSVLYGRITYLLMEYWLTVVKDPTGNKSMDEFAVSIDKIPKIVFSHTLTHVEWKTARLAKKNIEEELLELKQKANKNILIGSPTLIMQLTKLKLIDEYQLCIHPVVIGNGLPLFKNINDKNIFKFLRSKVFNSGAIILYYQPTN